MEQRITAILGKFMTGFYFPEIGITDIVEVFILTYIIYKVIVWIKNTKAWTLIRGIGVLIVLIFVAFIFQMNTILYLARYSLTVLATAAIVVFQPELRRALERLGEKDYFSMFNLFEKGDQNLRFSKESLENMITAVYSMSEVKTGALIVIEQTTSLGEYEATGIPLDCLISSQVLINIFEHNTPLHDGAIIVRGDRIASATCYLPLSDNNNLSKEMGTRHRAAVGISEVTDAMVLVVSEETGSVSVAENGRISRHLGEFELRELLLKAQNPNGIAGNINVEQKKNFFVRKWKGNKNNERRTDD